jgi:hypothetical protein
MAPASRASLGVRNRGLTVCGWAGQGMSEPGQGPDIMRDGGWSQSEKARVRVTPNRA